MLGIRKFKKVAIDLYQGDITTFCCDVMVNAANPQLAGGGGVDGAIHQAAGPILKEELSKYDGCPTGSAVLTGPGNLPAQFVVHAVGPVWAGGSQREPELLANAYKKALALAVEKSMRHIAFPAISTGSYGYPIKEAADVALNAARDFLAQAEDRQLSALRRITFVLFSKPDYLVFQDRLFSLFPESDLVP